MFHCFSWDHWPFQFERPKCVIETQTGDIRVKKCTFARGRAKNSAKGQLGTHFDCTSVVPRPLNYFHKSWSCEWTSSSGWNLHVPHQLTHKVWLPLLKFIRVFFFIRNLHHCHQLPNLVRVNNVLTNVTHLFEMAHFPSIAALGQLAFWKKNYSILLSIANLIKKTSNDFPPTTDKKCTQMAHCTWRKLIECSTKVLTLALLSLRVQMARTERHPHHFTCRFKWNRLLNLLPFPSHFRKDKGTMSSVQSLEVTRHSP